MIHKSLQITPFTFSFFPLELDNLAVCFVDLENNETLFNFIKTYWKHTESFHENFKHKNLNLNPSFDIGIPMSESRLKNLYRKKTISVYGWIQINLLKQAMRSSFECGIII